MPGYARGAAFAAAGLALLTGCSDDTSDPFGSSATSSSVVVVDPQYFLGSVPCSRSEGAMQSYVATLADESLGGFVLPSSPPVSCSDRVLFRYVVPGHEYSARVEGYEQPPEALVPFGGGNSGSRMMQLVASGDLATPRWTTECAKDAEGDSGSTAIAGSRIEVRGCLPLDPQSGIGTTSIVLDPRLALGGLTCGDGPGQVSTFDVVPEPGLLSYVNVPCDVGAPFIYEDGIEPGRTYTFQIKASVAGEAEEDAQPRAARCQATATAGLQVSASCTALSGVGALAIPLGSILADSGAGCQASVALFAIGDDVPVALLSPVPCNQTVSASQLAPGIYKAEINVLPAMPPAAQCAGEVRPGETTVCQPVPSP